ncbi:MAG: hypothetical protein A2Y15_05410 [Clostridiales bacterium GWF2_36_10]|nr:MAG: hypothetical protein A2Y15_05410 [Clostridiales bacterium GWF2_36_10]HAN20102.1 epimerase [Clostridiales bacterium]
MSNIVSKSSILILGGSYFIGRKIAEVFEEYGYSVSILNRGTKPLTSLNIEQITCDRNDTECMKKALNDRRFDCVVDVSFKDSSWVENLCDTLDFETVKSFVFISTSAVYDIENLKIPFKENDKLAENKYWTSYGLEKINAEKYYTDYFASMNTRLIILRPPYIYGENNYAKRESLIFKHICESNPIIIPKTNPKLQFIYTDDLAKIINHLFKNNASGTFNVGNKKSMTARDWVNACAKVVDKKVKIIECDYKSLNRNVRDFFPFFDYDNVLDVRKINSIFNEETPIETGLSNAYKWFLDNKSQIAFKENIEKNICEILAKSN